MIVPHMRRFRFHLLKDGRPLAAFGSHGFHRKIEKESAWLLLEDPVQPKYFKQHSMEQLNGYAKLLGVEGNAVRCK